MLAGNDVVLGVRHETEDDARAFLANAESWANHYAERKRVQGGSHDHIRHPATWINSRDWEDRCELSAKRPTRLRSALEELEGL